MHTFDWQDSFALGLAEMDDTHHEFVDVVDALLQAADADVPAAFERVAAHLQAHFEQERQWMAATEFPSAGCHLDEHTAVLASVGEVRALDPQRQVPVMRAFARELTRWFPEHAAAMDSGLAQWVVQRRLGGAPVVIQRRRSAQEA